MQQAQERQSFLHRQKGHQEGGDSGRARTRSHAQCGAFRNYSIYLPKGMWSSAPIFVSARTNKKHQHHVAPAEFGAMHRTRGGVWTAHTRKIPLEFTAYTGAASGQKTSRTTASRAVGHGTIFNLGNEKTKIRHVPLGESSFDLRCARCSVAARQRSAVTCRARWR
jgi:hypothetical protein